MAATISPERLLHELRLRNCPARIERGRLLVKNATALSPELERSLRANRDAVIAHMEACRAPGRETLATVWHRLSRCHDWLFEQECDRATKTTGYRRASQQYDYLEATYKSLEKERSHDARP